jgi:hypothetical protein
MDGNDGGRGKRNLLLDMKTYNADGRYFADVLGKTLGMTELGGRWVGEIKVLTPVGRPVAYYTHRPAFSVDNLQGAWG